MISITASLATSEGNFAGPASVGITCSGTVSPQDISALWDSIKAGCFERNAKVVLQKLCVDLRFNDLELLT